jgi:hypothetical protein
MISLAIILPSCEILNLFLAPQEVTPVRPMYKRIEGTNFEIYEKYLTYKKVSPLNETYDKDVMDWDMAATLCNQLGDGWRLPTNAELMIMGKKRELWSGVSGNHWGANGSSYTAVAFTQNGPESFGQGVASKKSEFRVRPVRTFQN